MFIFYFVYTKHPVKTFLLPIWWYNRGLFPLGNKYFGIFVLKGLITSICLVDSFGVNYLQTSWTPTCRAWNVTGTLVVDPFLDGPSSLIGSWQTTLSATTLSLLLSPEFKTIVKNVDINHTLRYQIKICHFVQLFILLVSGLIFENLRSDIKISL